MRIHTEIKSLKQKYLIHKKQQKFQVSFLDWTPYFDWYFSVVLFFIGLIAVGLFAFITYKNVINNMNDFENVEVRDVSLDVDGYSRVKKEYDSRAEVLNTVR
jgi:hypothetical protein